MLLASAMSVAPSIPTKMYIGSWKLCSALMIKRRKEFPIMPMRYMALNGIPIQHCTDSRPGIPISVSTEGMKTVMLEGYMVFLGFLMSNKRSFSGSAIALYFLFLSKVNILRVSYFGRPLHRNIPLFSERSPLCIEPKKDVKCMSI
jgi:hypothetical protein